MAMELEFLDEEQPVLPINPRSSLTYVQQICLQEKGCCEGCPENLLESIPCQVKYSNGVRQVLGLEKQVSPLYSLEAQERIAKMRETRKSGSSRKARTVSFAPPDRPLTLFGEMLQTRRLERKMSVQQLALKAKTDTERIIKLERGIINPGIVEAMGLAQALGYDPIPFIQSLV